MKTLFIIILSFNGGKNIIDCLESVINSQTPSGWEKIVLVVDNDSKDGSPENIQNLKVKIVKNSRNLGFAAGMNVGIKRALNDGAKAILLLNQDTIVKKDFLVHLLENSADIVSPIIKFKRKGEWVYDLGGKVNWWIGRTVHFESTHLGGVTASSSTQPDTIRGERKIDYVSGCAVLVKRPVLEKIGLLDERHFLYFEDVDFCLRARKAGFKIAVEPKSIIAHRLSEKTERPLKQHLYLLKSNFIFINHYIPIYRRLIAYAYLKFLFIKLLLNQINEMLK